MDERGCAHRTELNRAELSWGATPVVCRSKCVERSAREIEMQNGPIYAAGEYVTCPRINQCMTCFAWCLCFSRCCCYSSLFYAAAFSLCVHGVPVRLCVCRCDCFDSFAMPPPCIPSALYFFLSHRIASLIRPERAQIPSFIPFYPLFTTMMIIIVAFLLHLNRVWENIFI